jgi:hypothetical protein
MITMVEVILCAHSQCTVCKNEPLLCQLMVIQYLWLCAFGKEAKGDKAFNEGEDLATICKVKGGC